MSKTGTFETTEFRRSFHQETSQLLRKRLIWFISIWGGLGLISFVGMLIFILTGSSVGDFLTSGATKASYISLQTIWVGGYIAALFVVIEKRVSVQRVVRLSMALIILDGFVAVSIRMFEPSLGYGVWVFVLSHFIACCVFPWTIRQAIVPIVVVIGASSLGHYFVENEPFGMVVFYGISAVAFNLPAIFISGFKHNQRVQQSTNRFLNHRYGMLRQELAYARQIHESLFPAPKTTGQIQFVYRYEPMRQIGGDFLFARHTEIDDNGNESLSVVVIDVTGHGIPAALTVNRLHGEIDLRFAEDPDISPGELLSHLNRYIHLTLSKHSIFATAVCFRVIPSENKLEYASGGHPPSFLRGVDGTIQDLNSTTFVLGACAAKDFDPEQVAVHFGPGDSLIAYTDGATEARSAGGKMLQIEGLRRIVASTHPLGGVGGGAQDMQGQWSEKILREVSIYRDGIPPDDDTLAIEIYRPVRVIDCTISEEDEEAVGGVVARV